MFQTTSNRLGEVNVAIWITKLCNVKENLLFSYLELRYHDYCVRFSNVCSLLFILNCSLWKQVILMGFSFLVGTLHKEHNLIWCLMIIKHEVPRIHSAWSVCFRSCRFIILFIRCEHWSVSHISSQCNFCCLINIDLLNCG